LFFFIIKKGYRMKTLGERLKALRELRRLSQLELGDKIGVAQTAISAVEIGGATRLVVRLAQVLECDPVWLETGKGFSPFSTTLQYITHIMYVPLIAWEEINNFI
jgi:DNA-binding XRE family transcriptional regulator